MANTNFKVKNGLETPSIDAVYTTDQSAPTIRPTLDLNFALSKELDPRITFSRASTATYYDGTTTVKAEENCITSSESLQSWNSLGTTVTADTTATTDPIGTNTAELLTANTSSTTHLVYQYPGSIVPLSPYTVSVHFKQGTSQYANVSLYVGTTSALSWALVAVNLSTGVITQTSNGTAMTSVSSSIVSIGNGWYRVSVTGTPTVSTTSDLAIGVGVLNTGTPTVGNYGIVSWTAAGTETVYAWGAQMEQRAGMTAYTKTTAYPVIKYIPKLQTAAADIARFNHDPVTKESKGLLIEQQKTNIVTYSSDINLWASNLATVRANSTIAPDGTLSADLVVGQGTTNSFMLVSTTLALDSYATVSFFIKNHNSPQSASILRIATSAQGVVVNWNTTTPSILDSLGIFQGDAASEKVLNYGYNDVGNGWYRVFYTVQVKEANTGLRLYGNQAGTLGSGAYFWGVQCEVINLMHNNGPTSYIPTSGASATRSPDSAVISGSNFTSWYNPSEGTLFADVDKLDGYAQGAGQFSLGIGIDSTRYIGLDYLNYTNVYSLAYVQPTNADLVLNPSSLDTYARKKIALSYSGSFNPTINASANGVGVTEVGSGSSYTQYYTDLKIGTSHFSPTVITNLHMARIQYYPKAFGLTDLNEITS